MVYDGLLVLAIWMITVLILVVARGSVVQGFALQSLLVLEWFAFFAFFWQRTGQTLGMMAWRLRVEDARGPGLTLAQSALRFVGAVTGAAAFGLGYLWMLWDPQRRTWSDLLSRSWIRLEPHPVRG